MVKTRVLRADEMMTAWETVRQIPVELRPVDIRSALEIASHYNIYAYDAYFLECAISLRCSLLTLDRNMKKTASNIGIKILE
jgi:predicted nucleic acid-binding protein